MKVLTGGQIISGFLVENPLDQLPELTHCGEALCCAGHHLKPHQHPVFEFLYLSRGRVTWRAEGETTAQGMGDLFIAYPGEKHGTGAEPNPENHHLWMGLGLDNFGREGARLATRLRRLRPRLLTGCDEVESVMRGLMRQVVAQRARRADAIVAALRLFMALVEQQLDVGTGRGQLVGPRLPYSYGVRKAIDFLQQNLQRRLPLADLASIATARSVPYFCTQFRREVGVTPSAHHLQLRLNAAREALRQPAFGVTTAALQYGFSSSQHFSTQFRRAFGVTPRAWQRGSQWMNSPPVKKRPKLAPGIL